MATLEPPKVVNLTEGAVLGKKDGEPYGYTDSELADKIAGTGTLVTSDGLDADTAALVADSESAVRTALDAQYVSSSDIEGSAAVIAAAESAVQSAVSAIAAPRVVTDVVNGGTYTADLADGDVFVLTLQADATLEVVGVTAGRGMVVQINQDSAGGHTLTLPDHIGTVTLDKTALTFETVVFRSNDGINLIAHQAPGGPVAVGAGLLPEMLTDGLIWLDPATIAGDDGDPIDSSIDINGFDTTVELKAAPSTARPTLRVVNGEVVIEFDGSDDFLGTGSTFTAGQPLTIALLAKADEAKASVQVLVGTNNSAASVSIAGSGSSSQWRVGAESNQLSGVSDDQTWTVVTAVVAGADSLIRVDGTEQAAAGIGAGTTPTALRIGMTAGGSSPFDGLVGFVIVLGHEATADELTALETFLHARRARIEGS